MPLQKTRGETGGFSNELTRWTIASFLIVLVLNSGVVPAQTHGSTPAATGTVEGRVFGVTRSGDLKPARMPSMYLLYKGRGESLEENSADDHYQNTLIATSIATSRGQLEASAGDEDLHCREGLLDTDKTLADTAQWALDNKRAKQVLTTDGDEDGHFRIARVPVGRYRLVARGQAGANDAYWESSIVVKAGVVTSTKLTSPGKSCLHVE